jgi:hypothetical protein
MAKKKKLKKFDVVKAVKSAARATVGTPPPTRKAPAKPKPQNAPEKHKLTLGKLLEEE